MISRRARPGQAAAPELKTFLARRNESATRFSRSNRWCENPFSHPPPRESLPASLPPRIGSTVFASESPGTACFLNGLPALGATRGCQLGQQITTSRAAGLTLIKKSKSVIHKQSRQQCNRRPQTQVDKCAQQDRPSGWRENIEAITVHRAELPELHSLRQQTQPLTGGIYADINRSPHRQQPRGIVGHQAHNNRCQTPLPSCHRN
jgi:hypothetical protein